ncbi:MAG TPA: hypothetical protein V6D20_18335, partial [Candidatus Obscuribacterales bacterium]
MNKTALGSTTNFYGYDHYKMGDIVDELGNTLPVPGNGRAKRARIDREGNLVANNLYYYDSTSVRRSVRDGLIFVDQNNLLSYGAVKDGVPGVSGPINDAAFAAAVAAGVDNLTIPCGNYYFSSTIVLPAEMTLQGEVKNCTIIQSAAAIAVQTNLFNVVRNLFILNNSGAAGTAAIDMQGSQQTLVENVRTGALVSNVYDTAIRMEATAGSNINTNTVKDSILNGNVLALEIDGTLSAAFGNSLLNNIYGTLSASTNVVLITQASGTVILGGSMESVGATNGINLSTGALNTYLSIPATLGTITNDFVETETADNVILGDTA